MRTQQPYFKVYNRYMIQYNASLTAYKHALQSSSFQQFLEVPYRQRNILIVAPSLFSSH